MAEENFTPFKGARANIEKVGSLEGAMLFAHDTGELFFDTRTEKAPTTISRVQVNANKLVESTNREGNITTETITIKDIKNKMDKAAKDTENNSIALLDANGQVYRSDFNINNIANGVNAIYTQVSLTPENWTQFSKKQVIGIPNLTEESLVVVGPSDYQTASKYNIYCSGQGRGSLTFTCLSDLPKETVSFNIIIYTEISGGDANRYVIESALSVEDWDSNKRQRIYDDKIKVNSVLIPSLTDYEDRLKYNIYGVNQGNSESENGGQGYIEFETTEIPDKQVPVTILIENYTQRGGAQNV